MSVESFQFVDEETQNLMSAESLLETSNSFTALLELSLNQAAKLLHSPDEATPNVLASVFSGMKMNNSPELTSTILTNLSNLVKDEPIESGCLHNSTLIVPDPEPVVITKSTKRKDREKKVKSSGKKIKSAAKETNGAEKLPYVHVRARRGEATDSHSLAERARREKINARMKLLQELVPGCNKISGTAMVLEEIINHVQSLQLQVEVLSMKLAAIHPITDINPDGLFSNESGSPMDYNFTGMISPSWWVDGNTQRIWRSDGVTNLATPDSTHVSYDSSGNSGEAQIEAFLFCK